MVLLYMVLHGSHEYTPNVSIYTSTMDPMGMILYTDENKKIVKYDSENWLYADEKNS